MMPERKSTSTKIFTIRLGLGSVLFAALITFVGLAWIFFLGVMAGRMYYGVDPTTLAQKTSQNQQLAATTPPPSPTMPSKPPHATPEKPAQNKSITTYQPVIKDDNIAERVAQGQEPFPRNDFKDMATKDENDVVKVETKDIPSSIIVDDTSAEESAISPADSVASTMESASSTSDSQDFGVSVEAQGADFIERVDTEKESLPTSTEPTIPATVTVDEQGPVVETPQDVLPIEPNTSSVDIDAASSKPVPEIAVEDTTTSHTTKNIDKNLTSINQQIFDYTYQLATFKNPDSAHSITSELVADGLNATVLTEERNGTLFHYILVYHQGSEESKKALEKKLAQHNFSDFIVRSKVAQ